MVNAKVKTRNPKLNKVVVGAYVVIIIILAVLAELSSGNECGAPPSCYGNPHVSCPTVCYDERILQVDRSLLIYLAGIVSYAFLLYVLKAKKKRVLSLVFGAIALLLLAFTVLYSILY